MSVLRNQKFCGSHPNLRLFARSKENTITKINKKNNFKLTSFKFQFSIIKKNRLVIKIIARIMKTNSKFFWLINDYKNKTKILNIVPKEILSITDCCFILKKLR